MRIKIHVDQDWHVHTSGDGFTVERTLGKCQSSQGEHFYPIPPPDEIAQLPHTHEGSLCIQADADHIEEGFQRLQVRQPVTEEFGCYLFDTLIGRPTWARITSAAQNAGESQIELALCWDKSERDLTRLNWEMMRGPNGFLAAGEKNLTVAITRIIEGASNNARQLSQPPRILFVVGSSLAEPEMRAGAEYIGLLRQFRPEERAVVSRVLENATLKLLGDEMGRFKPDVVFFICHGGFDSTRRGFLLFHGDGPSGEEQVSAEQLGQCFVGDDAPPIVVLSACETGTSNVLARLYGPKQTAPFAAELVRGGVPIVVGMAGRVSDLACRLFTRQFGAALVKGEELVKATALARRAAFTEGKPPHKTPDWSYPALYMSEQVDPHYTPVVPGVTNPYARLTRWMRNYKLREKPLFCGRDEFFRAYYTHLDSTAKDVLAIFDDPIEAKGLGRTRLLEELTRTILLDGNIPVLVRPKSSDIPMDKITDFGLVVKDALEKTAEIFGLYDDDENVYESANLNNLKNDYDKAKEYFSNKNQYIYRILNNERKITANSVRLALAGDIKALTDAIRKAHSDTSHAKGKVVLLIDDLHFFPNGTVCEIFEGILKASIPVRPDSESESHNTPVIVAFRKESDPESYLTKLILSNISNIELMQLGKFKDGEGVLAYKTVLLKPFNPWLKKDISDKAWVVNDDVASNIMTGVEKSFKEAVDGIPFIMSETDKLYTAAMTIKNVTTPEAFIEAEDDTYLDRVRGQRP